MDIHIVHRALGFLSLPGEIRNKIYRLLLRSENALIKTSNRAYEDSGSESEPFEHDHEFTGDPHTLQAVSPWLTRYDFGTAILRTNRQIYKEAASILYDDNVWIVVTINTVGFASQLKSAGFQIVSRQLVNDAIKPALKVSLTFQHLNPTGVLESFLLSHDCLQDFARALWITRGMRDLEVFMGMPVMSHSGSSMGGDILLNSFEHVRGIQKLSVNGPKAYETEIRRVVSLVTIPFMEIAEIKTRVDEFRELGKTACLTGDWEAAQDHYLHAMCFLSDACKNCPHLLTEAAAAATTECYGLIEAASIVMSNLALCRINLGNFRDAAKNANYVLIYTTMPPHITVKAWYRRGIAFIGLGEDRKALPCLLEALDISPKDPEIIKKLKALRERLNAAKSANKNVTATVRRPTMK